MKTILKNNSNKYQMLDIDDIDIHSATLSSRNTYPVTKYVSKSEKTFAYDFEISNEDAYNVFGEVVGKEYTLLVTINSDGTLNTQKVHPRKQSKCFYNIQIPTEKIIAINE